MFDFLLFYFNLIYMWSSYLWFTGFKRSQSH